MSDNKKNVIFYARTYRRLNPNVIRQVLFIVFLVLPVLILYLLFYPLITKIVSEWTSSILADALGRSEDYLIGAHDYIPFFGHVSYVSISTGLPTVDTVLTTAFTCLILIIFFTTGKRRGIPISIFCLFGVTIQLISCLFFFIDASIFPYGETDYSVLYMLQQTGIWLFFIIIAGFVVGLISHGGILLKLITFFGILLYSFVFGSVRYVVYLYLIARFSTLYMATLFFALGPFFDFLYLVFFYSLFVNRLNTKLNRRDRIEAWRWT